MEVVSYTLLNRCISGDRLARAVEEKQVTCVLSPNHTGTWFVLDFLAEHPQTNDLVEYRKVLATRSIVQRSILHAHIGGRYFPLHPNEVDKYAAMAAYTALVRTGRVIIPLRDPMQALITRQCRHPFLDHRCIVEAFLNIANDHPGVTFVPVDCEPSRRADVLRALLVGAQLDAREPLVMKWVADWKPRNSVGVDTPEKKMYRAGNLNELRKAIEPEIDYLLESRPTLIPFLKSQGYKEMSWWSM